MIYLNWLFIFPLFQSCLNYSVLLLQFCLHYPEKAEGLITNHSERVNVFDRCFNPYTFRTTVLILVHRVARADERKEGQNIAERWWWLRVHMFGHTIMVGVGLPFLMGIETRVLEVFTLTLYHPLTNQFAQSKLQTLQDGRVCPKLPKRNSVARTEARDRKYSNFLDSFLFPIIVLSTFNITSHEALFINSNRNPSRRAYPAISLLRGPVKSKETLSRNRHAQTYYH